MAWTLPTTAKPWFAGGQPRAPFRPVQAPPRPTPVNGQPWSANPVNGTGGVPSVHAALGLPAPQEMGSGAGGMNGSTGPGRTDDPFGRAAEYGRISAMEADRPTDWGMMAAKGVAGAVPFGSTAVGLAPSFWDAFQGKPQTQDNIRSAAKAGAGMFGGGLVGPAMMLGNYMGHTQYARNNPIATFMEGEGEGPAATWADKGLRNGLTVNQSRGIFDAIRAEQNKGGAGKDPGKLGSDMYWDAQRNLGITSDPGLSVEQGGPGTIGDYASSVVNNSAAGPTAGAQSHPLDFSGQINGWNGSTADTVVNNAGLLNGEIPASTGTLDLSGNGSDAGGGDPGGAWGGSAYDTGGMGFYHKGGKVRPPGYADGGVIQPPSEEDELQERMAREMSKYKSDRATDDQRFINSLLGAPYVDGISKVPSQRYERARQLYKDWWADPVGSGIEQDYVADARDTLLQYQGDFKAKNGWNMMGGNAGFAKGGQVPAALSKMDPPGPDDQYIAAQSGEGVITREAMKKLGPAVLAMLNKGKISREQLMRAARNMR